MPLFERSLVLAVRVDARFIFGVAGVSAATLHARAGDGDRALDLYAALLDHWRRAGVWTQQWTTLRTLTELLTDRGEARAAAALLGALRATTTAAPAFGALEPNPGPKVTTRRRARSRNPRSQLSMARIASTNRGLKGTPHR